MGKLKTTIVNSTNKTLQLFDQTSNGEYTQQAKLLGTRNQPNRNVTVETTESSPQETNIVGEPDYLVECDPNQTYWTLSVWHCKEVVLSISSDELIDCAVITIGWDKDEKKFTKDCKPRYINPRSFIVQLLHTETSKSFKNSSRRFVASLTIFCTLNEKTSINSVLS